MPTFEELVARFSHLASTPAMAGVFLTASVLVVMKDSRVLILAYALQSVFAGLLFTEVLPPRVAGIKLLVGLLIAVLYFVTAQQIGWRVAERGTKGPDGRAGDGGSPAAEQPEAAGPRQRAPWRPLVHLAPGLPFRIFAVLMIAVVGWQTALSPELALPALSEDVTLATFLLVGLGLLMLGLTEEPLKAGIGLLTVLTGFELFYAAVEPALAVIALLAAVDFAVALGSSYLAIIRAQQANQGETSPR